MLYFYFCRFSLKATDAFLLFTHHDVDLVSSHLADRQLDLFDAVDAVTASLIVGVGLVGRPSPVAEIAEVRLHPVTLVDVGARLIGPVADGHRLQLEEPGYVVEDGEDLRRRLH